MVDTPIYLTYIGFMVLESQSCDSILKTLQTNQSIQQLNMEDITISNLFHHDSFLENKSFSIGIHTCSYLQEYALEHGMSFSELVRGILTEWCKLHALANYPESCPEDYLEQNYSKKVEVEEPIEEATPETPEIKPSHLREDLRRSSMPIPKDFQVKKVRKQNRAPNNFRDIRYVPPVQFQKPNPEPVEEVKEGEQFVQVRGFSGTEDLRKIYYKSLLINRDKLSSEQKAEHDRCLAIQKIMLDSMEANDSLEVKGQKLLGFIRGLDKEEQIRSISELLFGESKQFTDFYSANKAFLKSRITRSLTFAELSDFETLLMSELFSILD